MATAMASPSRKRAGGAGKHGCAPSACFFPPLTRAHLASLTENDPISLEPLSELGYPPFELSSEDSEGNIVKHLFDGQVLGYYLVSRLNFENPMTREPLTREMCVALDKYYAKHKLTKKGMSLSVARAFDMAKRRNAGSIVLPQASVHLLCMSS